MTNNLEKAIIKIIATDRIDMPISSMSGKLKRAKPKMAKALNLAPYNGSFEGERVYARIADEDTEKARELKEAVADFCNEFPKYGDILRGKVAEKRVLRETHLYFGVNEGCKLTTDDYMGVMTSLGFTEKMSAELYPALMNISRNLSKKRNYEERSILIGPAKD
jgi:hypothetical protein